MLLERNKVFSTWEIKEDFLSRIKIIVNDNLTSNIVQERIEKNINRKGIDLSKKEIWKALIGCHITSNQKSGEGSSVDIYMKSTSPCLDYKKCINVNESEMSAELSKYQIRYNKKISQQLIENLSFLENGGWDKLLVQLNKLLPHHSRKDELDVIDYLLNEGKLKGIGLKQSRNFLQWLGLSIYEIPIDSRVCKVLKECGCNFVPEGEGLQDRVVYKYIEDGLINIAEKIGIKPCILDGCLFNSLEK